MNNYLIVAWGLEQKENNIVSKIYFSDLNNSKESNFDSFGVDIKTGEINISVFPGLINYSQFSKNKPNSFAYPFSVLQVNDERFLYSEGKLGYIIDSNKRGMFFNYENNILKNIFLLDDKNYYMKYDLTYTNGLFSSIDVFFASSDVNLSNPKQMEYDLLGRLIKYSYNGASRFIEYDDINRVIKQKFVSDGKVLYSLNYDYQATKTIVLNYYKDLEILMSATTYDYSSSNIKVNIQENISYLDLETFSKFNFKEEVQQSNLFSAPQDLILQNLIKSMGYSLNLNRYMTIDGVDYASHSKKNIYFSLNGFKGTFDEMIAAFNNSVSKVNLYGKASGLASVKLEVDGFLSQGILVKVPMNGSINVDVSYAGIVVPIGLNNLNNASNVSVKYFADDGTVLSARKLISKNRPYDYFGFLVTPNKPGKIVIEEKWSGYKNEINIDGLVENDLKIIDLVLFDGNIFTNSSGAALIYNCQDYNGVKQKECYRDFVLQDAKLKKDPLTCIDVFNYSDAYWVYALNCVKQIDTTNALNYEVLNSKLKLKTIPRNYLIYTDLMKYYDNVSYCSDITDVAKKSVCDFEYAKKH